MTKGQFKKGHDPRRNLKGRPKSSQSTAEQVREWVTYLIEKNWPRLEAALDSMSDKEAAFFIAQYLLKHKLPTPQDEILRLTDEDFEKLVRQLQERQKQISYAGN